MRELARNGVEYHRYGTHIGTTVDRQHCLTAAETMTAAKPMFRSLEAKPTNDFPHGGKGCGLRPKFEPNPIVTPVMMTQITGSVRRMAPLDMSPEKLRSLWSEGRERMKRDAALDFASKESPIGFHNPLKVLPPVKMGVKAVEGRSNTSLEWRPADQNCVAGFRGLGNKRELALEERNGHMRHCVRTNTVDPRSLPFYGQRKDQWVPFNAKSSVSGFLDPLPPNSKTPDQWGRPPA